MALKRQNDIQATFSMASMTDVIFLLLVFFMATSTFVFPTAMEVNLPQSSEQTSVKPATRVYIDAEGLMYASYNDQEPQQLTAEALGDFLEKSFAQDPSQTAVAVYADQTVEYGKIIEVLNVGATKSIKMVLATRPDDN